MEITNIRFVFKSKAKGKGNQHAVSLGIYWGNLNKPWGISD